MTLPSPARAGYNHGMQRRLGRQGFSLDRKPCTRGGHTAHAKRLKAEAWQEVLDVEGAAGHAAAADDADLGMCSSKTCCLLRSQAKAICPGNAAICLQSATFKRTCFNIERPSSAAVNASGFHYGSSTAFCSLGVGKAWPLQPRGQPMLSMQRLGHGPTCKQGMIERSFRRPSKPCIRWCRCSCRWSPLHRRVQALWPWPHTRCGRRGCSRSDREPGSEHAARWPHFAFTRLALGTHCTHSHLRRRLTRLTPRKSLASAGASGARICNSETTKASHSLT